MSEKNGAERARAKQLLHHYFETVWRKAGLRWDSDNTVEVEAIVDAILDAAAAQRQEVLGA